MDTIAPIMAAQEESHIGQIIMHHGDRLDHDHDVVMAESRVPMWLQNIMNKCFALKERGVTIEFELYCGLIQFISNLFVLPVIPFQLMRIGYNEEASIAATAIASCIGCILCGFLTDLPFIIAPPTAISIFFAVTLQQQGIASEVGNARCNDFGCRFHGHRSVSTHCSLYWKAAIAIGIGLLICLAGALEIHLVVQGKYTLIDMGFITDEVVIAIAAFILIGVMLHYQVKGAFCGGLIFGTIMWWFMSGEYPHGVLGKPVVIASVGNMKEMKKHVLVLLNLVVLYMLFLNGLARTLADMAKITKANGSVPKRNMLIIVSGLMTILSGYLTGPPVSLSPESAAGIKAGAKTGLSTVVCGILFGISVFFWPIFKAVPAAGTAPLLMFVGVLLFNNVKRIEWTDAKVAAPAFIVLCFIPFTYSILRGVAFGYIIHFFMHLFTGEYITNIETMWEYYTNRNNYTLRNIPALVSGGPLFSMDKDEEGGIPITEDCEMDTENPMHQNNDNDNDPEADSSLPGAAGISRRYTNVSVSVT